MWRGSTACPKPLCTGPNTICCRTGQDATGSAGRLNDLAARREEELLVLRAEQEKARHAVQQSRERLEKERVRLHEEVRGKAAELMRAWKEGRATSKQALKEMSRLRASLAPAVEPETQSVLPKPQHFTPGQNVLHSVFNKRGVITDVDERRGRVRLDMNGVNLWAEMKDLRESGGQAPQAAPRSAVKRGTDENASLSLDLRGMRADQALARSGAFSGQGPAGRFFRGGNRARTRHGCAAPRSSRISARLSGRGPVRTGPGGQGRGRHDYRHISLTTVVT